jgi:hypothetical protein
LLLNYLTVKFLNGTSFLIEYPGASYRLTSHGDQRRPIFVDDVDRESLIARPETGMSRFANQADTKTRGARKGEKGDHLFCYRRLSLVVQ